MKLCGSARELNFSFELLGSTEDQIHKVERAGPSGGLFRTELLAMMSASFASSPQSISG